MRRIAKESDMMLGLMGFLHENPNPPDDDVHSWAEEEGYEVEEVEKSAYALATAFVNFLYEGKAVQGEITEEDVDPDELAMGIQVEKEHTSDEVIAKRIAMDHLAEIDDYYTRLKAMEDSAENRKEGQEEVLGEEALINKAVSLLDEEDIAVTKEEVEKLIDIINHTPDGFRAMRKFLKEDWHLRGDDLDIIEDILSPIAHAMLDYEN